MPKKATKKKAVRKTTKRVVHHKAAATRSVSTYGWDKDRSMMIMLAAGTIILVVIGMYMAGWL